MTAKPRDERSQFARLFERTYRDVPLPSIYRDFILNDEYLRYRKAVIRGLRNYGPTDVPLNLSSSMLLKREHLFTESDIDLQDAAEYHPIAIVEQSPQFLAIETTLAAAPVFLWHHETGAFHRQFETFVDFVAALTTPAQAAEARRKTRQTFADIRRECVPALRRARKHLDAGDVAAAATVLDAVLQQRRPIRYDGRNDFKAIGILCDCFNLRGRLWLAQDRLADARAAFLDAAACGGTPYWEAAVDLIVTSFLLKDIQPAMTEVGQLEASDFPEPPGLIMRRNFSPHQMAAVKEVAMSPDRSEAEHRFASEVLSWIRATEGSDR